MTTNKQKKKAMEDMFDFAYVLGRFQLMEEVKREREKVASKDDLNARA